MPRHTVPHGTPTVPHGTPTDLYMSISSSSPSSDCLYFSLLISTFLHDSTANDVNFHSIAKPWSVWVSWHFPSVTSLTASTLSSQEQYPLFQSSLAAALICEGSELYLYFLKASGHKSLFYHEPVSSETPCFGV